MNVLKSLLAIFLIGGSMFYFNSCTKDASQDATSNLSLASSLTSGSVDYLIAGPGTSSDLNPCFSYVFPLNVRVGKDLVVVNSQEELDKLLMRNPTTNVRVQIELPYSVIVSATGETVVIKNEKDLDKILRDCAKSKRDTIRNPRDTTNGPRDTMRMGCYQLVFPLTVTLADGTVKTINSQEELNMLRRATTVRTAFRINFPFDVILKDGTTVTISNRDDLWKLETKCKGNRPGHK